VPARISHIASISNNPTPVATLYETIFGLELDQTLRSPDFGEFLSDGNITFNLRPRLAGHRVGLDHFGIEIDNMAALFDKLRADYPAIDWVAQPPEGANGDYFCHDPAGSIFALSQTDGREIGDRPSVRPKSLNFARWSKGDPAARYIHHYAIRTRKLEECAQFYHDIFGFSHKGPTADDPNHYLSDGRMTLMLIPWTITDYGGISVTGRGPDHIGFKVEDGAMVREEIDGYCSHFSPGQAPMWLLTAVSRTTDESQIRAAMIEKSCPISQYQFTDKDGVFVVISDRTFS
jgi:catechol 2,3-dioxygenase-like lactoylglutathione lyase family enzyme